MSRPVRRTAAAALTLALGLAVGACSRDEDPAEPAEPAAATPRASPTAAEPTVPTKVSFGEVTGRLDRSTRQQLATRIQAVVEGWTEAAYLGGDYPRRAFSDAWPGFMNGAAQTGRLAAEAIIAES